MNVGCPKSFPAAGWSGQPRVNSFGWKISSGTPKDVGPPSHKRDPYFKGFLWDSYGSSMGMGVSLLGVPGISLDNSHFLFKIIFSEYLQNSDGLLHKWMNFNYIQSICVYICIYVDEFRWET